MINNKSEQSVEQKADALFSKAKELYFNNSMDECLHLCTELIYLCKSPALDTILSKVYSLMGVLESRHDNEIQALEYYQKALDIALRNNDNLSCSMVYANIAVLYLMLKDCDKAEECFELSEQYCRKYKEENTENPIIAELEVRSLLNRCFIYCGNDKYTKAIEYCRSLNKYINSENELFIVQNQNVINAIIAYRLNLHDEFKKCVKQVIQHQSVISHSHEIFEQYLVLFHFLIESNEEELLREFLPLIQLDEDVSQSIHLLSRYYDTMIEYYKMISDQEKLSEIYEIYFSHIQKRKVDRMQSKLLNLKTKKQLHAKVIEQKQVEDEVNRLRQKSEHDALTGLPNRYLFNEYCNKYFQQALNNKTSFGVMIIDIDFFKGYNDNFGHIEGDKCIQMVADCINQAACGCFCARYGGDEFFVIDDNITTNRLRMIAQKIQEKVLAQKYPHPENQGYPYVTVSQGMCVAVPDEGQSYMEFVHEADMALYRGKDMHRNAIVRGNIGEHDFVSHT